MVNPLQTNNRTGAKYGGADAVSVPSHNVLSDLATGDDHPQYVRTDGTRAGWPVPTPTATDLAYDATTRLLTSSTGTDATLPLVSSADAGLAPASGGGTTNFLRADGTWAAPAGGGTVTSVAMTVPTGLAVTGTPITTTGTLAVALASGYSIPATTSQTNWDTAYTDRLKWDGGSTGLVAATGRTSLGLGSLATLSSVSTADLGNSQVTYAKIQNVSATDKILGRSTAGAGVVEEITCTAAGRALIDDADATAQRTTLGLGSLATLSSVSTANIGDDQVTYAKMQNVSATDRILGRSSVGAGDIQEITCTSFGRDLLDDTSVAAQRTTLGLGTIATQASSNVSITGGTISGVKITDYTEPKTAPAISAGTLTLDLNSAQVFDVSLNANITTLTISNVDASANTVNAFTLIFTMDGTARTVTWPASVKWAGGTAPTLTSTNAKKDVFSFMSPDNGTTWLAFVAGQNF